MISINLLQNHPNRGGFFCIKVSTLVPSFISEVHGHKHMGDALSWCFKKLSQRLCFFQPTHFYNLKTTVCSYSGTRILEKEESACFSLFYFFTNAFLKDF